MSRADDATTPEATRAAPAGGPPVRPSRPADHAAEGRALAALGEAAASDAATPRAVFESLAALAVEACRADAAGVGVFEPGAGFRVRARSGAPDLADEAPRDSYPLGPAVEPHPAAGAELLVVPVRIGGRAAGAAWIAARGPSPRFDAEDARLLAGLARSAFAAASALGRAEEERRSDAMLAAQQEVLERIVADAPLPEILARLCRIIEEQAGGTAGASIYLVEPGGASLRNAAAPSLPEHYSRVVEVIPIGPGVGCCGASAFLGEPVVSADLAADPAWEGYHEAALAAGFRAGWSMPIRSASGRVLGTIGTYFDEPRGPSPHERRVVEVLARTAALAIERVEAGMSLREQERRATAILESVSDAFFAVDRDWRFTYLNRHGERLLGRRREDLLGKVLWDEYAPALGTEFERAYRRAMAEGVTVSFEAAYEPLRGFYDVHAYPSPEGLSVYFREVSERRRAEAAILAGEERYRALFGAIDEGFTIVEMILDAEGRPVDYRFLEVNPAFAAHTGLHDPVGRTARELVPDLDAFWFETYGRVALTGEPTRFVQAAEAMDGRWFDVHASRVGGPGSLRVAILFHDITERRRAEQQLRASEGRLQLAVEIAQMGTFEIDLQTDEVTVNEPGRAIYGWPGPRTAFARVQAHFHPEDRDEVLRRVAEAFDPAGPGTFEVEQRIHRVDGALRWIKVRGRAVFEGIGPGRRAVRCLGTYLDVTDAKLAEEGLRENDRRKDEFLATLAHELRNPLAPIRLGLEVVRREGAEASGPALEMMSRQLGHMVHLVDDLLDVARVSQGKITLRRERIALEAAVRSALETSRPAVERAGHDLSVRLPAGPLTLDADLTRLAQVLSNLLNNAAKYTEPPGRIELSARREGAEVVISVRDSGVGIPAEMLPKVFDMFTQVGSSIDRAQGGLGIGLTLVRRLVEMHGGRVDARSEGPGLGSEFVVRLPLADGVDAPALPTADAPAAPHRAGRGRRRLLVVDDNRDSADMVARFLRLSGYEVRVAYDGESGLEAASAFRPGLVLLDIGLPGRNGYQVAHALRDDPATAGAVLVALTGWGQEEDRRRSREAGFDHHLVKPVDPEALEHLLRALAPAEPVGPA